MTLCRMASWLIVAMVAPLALTPLHMHFSRTWQEAKPIALNLGGGDMASVCKAANEAGQVFLSVVLIFAFTAGMFAWMYN